MHPLPVLLSVIGAVTASQIKAQYYYDGGCTDYAVEFYPPVGGCYNYAWSSSNSANIAHVTGIDGTVRCTFFTQQDCKGASQITTEGTNQDCASNWGAGFTSVSCVIIHNL
jgi:hypothetical protein